MTEQEKTLIAGCLKGEEAGMMNLGSEKCLGKVQVVKV
jgi:hypothetical protein